MSRKIDQLDPDALRLARAHLLEGAVRYRRLSREFFSAAQRDSYSAQSDALACVADALACVADARSEIAGDKAVPA